MTIKEELTGRLRNLEERLKHPRDREDKLTILDRIDTVKDELRHLEENAGRTTPTTGEIKPHGGSTMGKEKVYLDEQEGKSEIVYCRATKCVRNEGNGQCRITHIDDKISVDESGRCVQYFCS